MIQRVLSQSSVEHFLSHKAEKFCRGALYSSISLSLVLGYRKKLRFRGFRHNLLSNIFCL